ncbi:MAG: hypothetical protein E7552_07535, partial [Ruminococcaceae bacterium]|nr:hypothetical protein [Oscillospiraceae bacterium]
MYRYLRRILAAITLSALIGCTVFGVTATGANTSARADTAFEAWLSAQEFPESYRPALRELHSQYPNWVFRAQHTGLS